MINEKKITVFSYAKINLSIDVVGVLENGMHQVDMIMQQLSFHDDVTISFKEDHKKANGDIDIKLTTNRPYLPTDERNLAYKAAALLVERYGEAMPAGTVSINIFKRIPVAAGMAGGSGNGAAVLHGLNTLFRLKISLEALCNLASELGSDVPFCVMGQARGNYVLPKAIKHDPMAVTCARATGTGTLLEPVAGIRKAVVIAKPNIGVSTKAVYTGIDNCHIDIHPDNDRLAADLEKGDFDAIYGNFINVLELFTLEKYPQVKKLKERMKKIGNPEVVLMSGSGPTVFAFYGSIEEAKAACARIRESGYEAYWTKCMK